MASVTYRGTFCDANGNPQSAGSNGRNATATGGAIPSTATIKKVTYELDISADKYTSSKVWALHWLAVGSASGSPSASYTTATMYGNEHTFTGNMGFSQSDVSKFASGSIEVYAKANTTHDTTSYMGDFAITVEYDTYSKCGKPSNLALASDTSTGDTVELSWNAGTDGTDNAISYYQIARKESTDGVTWGSRSTWKSNAGKVTKYQVPPPSTPGNYYKYSVRAVGVAGTSYASDWAECSTALRNPPIAVCAAPSGLVLSAAATTGASVTLTWEAGGGGTHNALTHYQIAREESVDGITFGIREIYIADAGKVTSYNVPPPVSFGHHYRYSVRAVGAAGESYASAWVECSQTLEKLRPDMSTYTDATIEAGETHIKAAHITELQTNVNLLREAVGLALYSFTEIRAGYTSLAGWSAHVAELREALDDITTDHEKWLEITENRPRADVIVQLRRVVASV